MLRKFKFKKIYFLIILSIMIIFIIGSIAHFTSKSIKSFQEEKQIEMLLENNNLNNVFEMIDHEEKKINKEINKLLILANARVDSLRIEEEIKMINYLSPLIEKIESDPQKTEMAYAYEISNILNKVNLVNLDLNNTQGLNQNGSFFLSIADELTKIKPAPNYFNIHKAEVIIIGGIGYALKELSYTTNNERAVALIRIINDLIDYQKKISELLNQ